MPRADREIDAAGHIPEAMPQHVPAHVARVGAAEGQSRSLEAVYYKAAAIVIRPPAACLVISVAVVRRDLQCACHGIVYNSHSLYSTGTQRFSNFLYASK